MERGLPQRRSIRLADYDYAQGGAYFVTVCTWNHRCLFGRIVGDVMELNDAGRTVGNCWREIPVHFPHVELDAFVVMPNHIHGILIIRGNDGPANGGRAGDGQANVGDLTDGGRANDYSPLRIPGRPCGTSRTVGSIIRGFKTGVTKQMPTNSGMGDVWQRNYYEHVIRNEGSLNRIRRYIAANPASWACDKYAAGE